MEGAVTLSSESLPRSVRFWFFIHSLVCSLVSLLLRSFILTHCTFCCSTNEISVSYNPALQNMKTTRYKRMKVSDVNFVFQELNLHKISRDLPDVVGGGDYGYSFPVEMFHQTFKQLFHFGVGTFRNKRKEKKISLHNNTEQFLPQEEACNDM